MGKEKFVSRVSLLLLLITFQLINFVSGGVDVKYSKPVVYTNLPPPVLYFPNFPEKPKISERGEDQEEKQIEYVPLHFNELPLLVYQSQNQPPVHVINKNNVEGNNGEQQADVKNTPEQKPEPKTRSVYSQDNRKQYSLSGANQQQYPRVNQQQHPSNKRDNQQQYNSNERGHQQQYISNQNQYPATKETNQQPPSYERGNQQQYPSNMRVNQQQHPSNQMTPPNLPIVNSPDRNNHQPYQTNQFSSTNQGYSTIPNTNIPQMFQDNHVIGIGITTVPNVSPDDFLYDGQMNVVYPFQDQRQMASQNRPKPPLKQYTSSDISQLNPIVGSQNAQNSMVYRDQRPIQPLPTQNLKSNSQQGRDAQCQQNGICQYQQFRNQPSQSGAVQTQPNQQQGHKQQAQSNYQQFTYPQQQGSNQHQDNRGSHQPTNDDESNAQQYVGIPLSAPPQTLSSNNDQQRGYVRQAHQEQAQPDNEEEIEPQYISIAVYPYGDEVGDNSQMRVPHQYFTLSMPQHEFSNQNGEDEEKTRGSSTNNIKNNHPQASQQQDVRNKYRDNTPPGGRNYNSQGNVQSNLKQSSQENSSGSTKQNSEKSHDKEQQAAAVGPVQYQQFLIRLPQNEGGTQNILLQHNGQDQSRAPYEGPVQGSSSLEGSNRLLEAIRKTQQLLNSKQQTFIQAIQKLPQASPNPLVRVPGEKMASSASQRHPQSLVGNPFMLNPQVNRELQTGFHFGTTIPLSNVLRNPPPSNPYASASMLRPNFRPSPLLPPSSMFRPHYPMDMFAESSFLSPSIDSSRMTNNSASNVYPENQNTEILMPDFLSGYDSTPVESIQAFTHLPTQIESFYAGQRSPFLPTSNFQPPSVSQNGRIPNPYFFGKPTANKDNAKYGKFVNKLAALYSSLLSQSLGLKPQISSRSGTSKVNHHNVQFSVEEVHDPEDSDSRRKLMNTHRQGLEGIAIPLISEAGVFSRRTSGEKPERDTKPPIIVYKGSKPPLEIYGTKDDIEIAKPESKDPMEMSASEEEMVSRLAEDDIEQFPESVLDYVDLIYSMLPDFIKHSLSLTSDGAIAGSSGKVVDQKASDKSVIVESGITSNSSKSVQPNTPEKASSLDKNLMFSFKRDVEELSKLLNIEEKSDLSSF